LPRRRCTNALDNCDTVRHLAQNGHHRTPLCRRSSSNYLIVTILVVVHIIPMVGLWWWQEKRQQHWARAMEVAAAQVTLWSSNVGGAPLFPDLSRRWRWLKSHLFVHAHIKNSLLPLILWLCASSIHPTTNISASQESNGVTMYLLCTYFNRKWRLHDNSQRLQILTLIIEKRKREITHHCHYKFIGKKYPYALHIIN
jgi:hypothetical protein